MGIVKNDISKRFWVGAAITLAITFGAYTIHKIYVGDPEVYAQKIELLKIEKEAKADRMQNRVISLANEKAIIEIKNNFAWIKAGQQELKIQNDSIKYVQNEILKTLKEIKIKNGN